MKVPLLDLKAQHQTIAPEIEAAIKKVVEAQSFILGPEVKELEAALEKYLEVKYAIGCASGSDALLLALMAAGVGPGDEVITVPYTFFATVGSIVRLGAKAVFVDIEKDSYNMDMSQVEAVITPKTKAAIPVHLFGQAADLEPLLALGKKHGFAIIEDAAQAIGVGYKDKMVGAWGDYGCFSFFPSKNLGGHGDGGLITTNDEKSANLLKSLRVHGSRQKYFHEQVGINSRLDTLQAAVLLVKLCYLAQWSKKRFENAKLYNSLFEAKELTQLVQLPKIIYHDHSPASGHAHIFNQYLIWVDRRDDLQKYLADQGVSTAIYYPLPLHLQPCFAYLGYKKGDFPNSEQAAEATLALPIYPELKPEMIEYVVDQIRKFYQK